MTRTLQPYVGKRLFDLALSVVGLAVLAPLMAGVGVLVILEDGGSAFFWQERVGRQGRLFRIWKFRSMHTFAERAGASITIGLDERITRVGRLIRATKLDELPQLLNVVRGEMSLVGPRPEVPRYVALYTAEERTVLTLMPGITDLASIHYRNESDDLAQYDDPHRAYVEIIMPQKIRMNLWYSVRANLARDLSIILASVGIRTRSFARLMEAALRENPSSANG